MQKLIFIIFETQISEPIIFLMPGFFLANLRLWHGLIRGYCKWATMHDLVTLCT